MAEEQLEQFREACCNKCMPSQSSREEEHIESRQIQIEEHRQDVIEDIDEPSDVSLSIEDMYTSAGKQDSDAHSISASSESYCLKDFKQGTYTF